jgi:hypothetical protein
MAKLFLSENEIFTLTDGAPEVFGALGTETIKISGVPAAIIDQGVERIEFNEVLANYTFALKGNVLLVSLNGALAAQIAVNQTKLAFPDGSADFLITGLSQGTLGGGVVTSLDQSVAGVSLNSADSSSVGTMVTVSAPTTINVGPTGFDNENGGDPQSHDAGSSNSAIYFAQGSYNYSINGFGKDNLGEDSLNFKAGDSISIVNLAADGILNVQASDATTGTTVKVTLTGLDPALDSTIFNVSTFLGAFGDSSLVA